MNLIELQQYTISEERAEEYLQKQGVDVNMAQTALQNNDTAAVNSWLKSYFESHKDALANSTRQQWHPRNTTVSQSV